MKGVCSLIGVLSALIASGVVVEAVRPCAYAEMYYASLAGIHPSDFNFIPPSHGTKPCVPLTVPGKRFRRIDGMCNHEDNLGSTFLPVKRYLPADYDGCDDPRTYGIQGGYLPSPRLISRILHPDKDIPSHISLFVMQMGQFVDHDITSAPVPTEGGTPIECCNTSLAERNPECFPIDIPDGDPRFSNCMQFVRSEAAHDESGEELKYPREQLNALTSFLDGSVIYSSDEATNLRLRDGALMKTNLVNDKERLPIDTLTDCLANNTETSYCQLAGDMRVNEQPALAAIHLLFHLEHNNIARNLVKEYLIKFGKSAEPEDVEFVITHAPDHIKELIFQLTRRILGAVLQKIVYCDWLPIVLGPNLISKYHLGCAKRSWYKPGVDPRIANCFLSAAFRFGHSLIPNQLKVSPSGNSVALQNLFFVPDPAINNHESVTLGLTKEPSQRFDRFLADDLTNHLFENVEGVAGALDLAALNIQRGRDHGIPAYFKWRIRYGLGLPSGERLFGKEFYQEKVLKVYENFYDIDLFTGGSMERNVRRGLVGATFGNIIGNQFHDLKFGDRFFFLTRNMRFGFNDDQLEAIKASSLAGIACRNAKLSKIQRNPFLLNISRRNPLRVCDKLSDVDVKPFLPEMSLH